MSCSLTAIALCLSGLYLDGGLSVADSGVEIYREQIVNSVYQLDGVITSHRHVESIRSHAAENPYGRIAIGYEQTFFVPELRLSAELYHESSLATGRDRGVNGARISLRWYPFGAAR